MPQSLSQVLVHLVYSTKVRTPSITPELQPRLHAYLSTVLANDGHVPIIVGGHTDHVHMHFGLSRTATIASAVSATKTSSSRWMKEEFSIADFAWQHGYGVFSVSPGDQQSTVAYIANQETHHQVFSFQDEYRRLLVEFGITFDERYVWD
ncbi:MAG: transposase [Armatimonadetes bacterium]|nr:transposase [Armatimonadota bacterium]